MPVGLQPPKGGGTAPFADVCIGGIWAAATGACGGAARFPAAAGDAHGKGESSAAGGSRKDGAAEEMAEESDSGCTGDEALEDAERPDEYVDFCAEEAPEMVRS